MTHLEASKISKLDRAARIQTHLLVVLHVLIVHHQRRRPSNILHHSLTITLKSIHPHRQVKLSRRVQRIGRPDAFDLDFNASLATADCLHVIIRHKMTRSFFTKSQFFVSPTKHLSLSEMTSLRSKDGSKFLHFSLFRSHQAWSTCNDQSVLFST